VEDCGKKLKKRIFGKTEADGEVLFLDDSHTMEISKEEMKKGEIMRRRSRRRGGGEGGGGRRMEKMKKKGVYLVTVPPCE
jgi:hypothetical protein